jgi:hypothetical protein
MNHKKFTTLWLLHAQQQLMLFSISHFISPANELLKNNETHHHHLASK